MFTGDLPLPILKLLMGHTSEAMIRRAKNLTNLNVRMKNPA